VLPVKKSPNRSGPDAHGQLVLQDVVHCPSAVSNIIGYTATIDANYAITLSFSETGKSMGTIKDRNGQSVAYFAPKKRFCQVKLSGPPVGPAVGPSSLQDKIFVLNVRWSKSEQARWETYKQSRSDPLSVVQSKKETVKGQPKKKTVQEQPKNNKIQHPQPSAPYTTYEKQWLKVHYGNEYRFLQSHGLSIFKDEDREEGRAMVRQFMGEEGPEGKELVLALLGESEESADAKNDDTEDESEESDEDWERNMADYLFDEKSLRWIKNYYGTSMNFMHSFGLKIYEPDDWDEAQAIVYAMIEDEKELEGDSEDDDDDSKEEDDENSEVDLEGHMTDYLFDEKSLGWIEKHFGNSMKFMYSHGLKFYDDDDCVEAQNIARVMVNQG
jgi:hypothetical protein